MKKELIVTIASAIASAIIYHYVKEVIEDIADAIVVDDKKFNFEFEEDQ